MKATSSYKKALANIRRAMGNEAYAEALQQTDELLTHWPDNPVLLVLRANLIQLQDDASAPSLDEARAALQHAVVLAGDAAAPLIELGHFRDAVEDDPTGASECFAQAARLAREQLATALRAQAQTLIQLDRREEAFACLAEAYHLNTARNGAALTGPLIDLLEAFGAAHTAD